MELILRQDVENLGLATSSAKKVLAENLKQKAYKEQKLVDEANKLAKALLELEVKITAKTGAGTKLFGSVNNINLATALEKAGHEIERKYIKVIGGSVKRTGKYEAKIRLHRNVVVDFPFEVIAEA